MRDILYYCKKCGRCVILGDKDKKRCDYCLSIVDIVPKEFLITENVPIIKRELKEQFIKEYIKPSPEFDPYLFEHRDEDLHKRHLENMAKMAHGRAVLEEQNRQVTCPYCQSTRVSRIGLLSRIVSVELWGLASSKIGKQWRCDNCGSEF